VDPVSGAQTPLATVPTSFQSAALDASAGRLYLADPNTLYIVNVTTGTFATLALSQSLGSPYEIVFDRVSGLLFALVNNGSRIVSINPTTGNVSTVAITGVNSSQAGSLTVGSGGVSLFFLNNRTDLYRVTLATGVTTHIPLSEQVLAIQFDPATAKFIGLTDGFVMVDPGSGVVQSLTGPFAYQLIGTGGGAFLRYDPVARVAVVYAFANSSGTVKIITFAVATGTITNLDDPTFVSPIAISVSGASVPLLGPPVLAALAFVFCAVALLRLREA
jgi:hypothetical protein